MVAAMSRMEVSPYRMRRGNLRLAGARDANYVSSGRSAAVERPALQRGDRNRPTHAANASMNVCRN